MASRLAALLLSCASLAEAARKKYKTNSARIDAPGILNVHVIPHTHDDVGKCLLVCKWLHLQEC